MRITKAMVELAIPLEDEGPIPEGFYLLGRSTTHVFYRKIGY